MTEPNHIETLWDERLRTYQLHRERGPDATTLAKGDVVFLQASLAQRFTACPCCKAPKGSPCVVVESTAFSQITRLAPHPQRVAALDLLAAAMHG
jgi:hypothetical protein